MSAKSIESFLALLDDSSLDEIERAVSRRARRPGTRRRDPALLRRCLDGLGVLEWVKFDLKIVRGLAYYTGIVFELFDAKGELRAICGGGRYDNLLKIVGGVDLPALGFGMGDVVLSELLRERGLMPSSVLGPDVWLTGIDSGDSSAARVRQVATQLRRAGVSVEYSLAADVAQLAAQRRQAGGGVVRRRAPYGCRDGSKVVRGGSADSFVRGQGAATLHRSATRPVSPRRNREAPHAQTNRVRHQHGRRQEAHDPRGRLQRLVQRSRPARRARRLLARSRMHGHPPERLRHLGADAARPRRHVQGDGPRERVLPAVHSRELPAQGSRARRRLRAGGRRRHARRRQEARGAAHHPADVGDDHLLDVRQVGAELPRPAAAHEPVGERRPLGDAHASLPAHARVPLAGRAHRARHARRGGRGSAPDARRLQRLHGRLDGDAGHHRRSRPTPSGSPARCARTRAKR